MMRIFITRRTPDAMREGSRSTKKVSPTCSPFRSAYAAARNSDQTIRNREASSGHERASFKANRQNICRQIIASIAPVVIIMTERISRSTIETILSIGIQLRSRKKVDKMLSLLCLDIRISGSIGGNRGAGAAVPFHIA